MMYYAKLTLQDFEIAEKFFDNDKHLDEFCSNVIRYYNSKPLTIKTKIVEKYFESYKKTMDLVIKARDFGKRGGEQKADNQLSKSDTLVPPLEDTLVPPLLPKLNKLKENKVNKDLPKGEQEKSVHAQMTDIYFVWYENNYGMKPKFNGVDGKGIKDLCEYLEKNTDGAAEFFKNILDKWNIQDKFIQNQIKPNQIYSNINQIIAKLSKSSQAPKVDKPVVMQNYPNGEQYYSECLLKKQRPLKYGSGEQLTDEEIDQEFRKYKVGKYQYA